MKPSEPQGLLLATEAAALAVHRASQTATTGARHTAPNVRRQNRRRAGPAENRPQE
jgi:hypothetical protein